MSQASTFENIGSTDSTTRGSNGEDAVANRFNQEFSTSDIKQFFDSSRASTRDNGISPELKARMLGLPQIDLTGFEQEASAKERSIFSFFSSNPTVRDRVRTHTESKMPELERKQFERENEALKRHKDEVIAWGLQATINSGPYPERPSCPMHDKIEKRISETEKAIVSKVRAGMSRQDREQLDKEFKDYQEAMNKALSPQDPYGTGGGAGRLPKPGDKIKDFYRRVQEATEESLRKAA